MNAQATPAAESPFNHVLAAALRRPAGANLAGSIYAVPTARRDAVARMLADQQLWVHADVFAAGSSGVDPALITRLSTDGVRPIDVHLVTAGAVDFLDAVCGAKVARVTFPYEGVPDVAAVTSAVRHAGAAAWLAIAPTTPIEAVADLAETVDGLLVMLIEPGTRGRADLRMLGKVTAAAGTWPSVGVDGGVGEHNVARVLEAGADYVVVGRRLLSIAMPGQAGKATKQGHKSNPTNRRDTQ